VKTGKRDGKDDFDQTASPPKKVRPTAPIKFGENYLDDNEDDDDNDNDNDNDNDAEDEDGRTEVEDDEDAPGDESADPLDLFAASPQKLARKKSRLLCLMGPPSSSRLLATEENHLTREPIKAKRVNYKESSSDDDEEEELEGINEDGERSASKSIPRVKQAVIKAKVTKGRSKGKAKESKKLASARVDQKDSFLLPTPVPSHYGPPASAPVENLEQRTKDWNLNRMDDFVWVLLKGDDYDFFWPAEVNHSSTSSSSCGISMR
jgi:hypothetical protein